MAHCPVNGRSIGRTRRQAMSIERMIVQNLAAGRTGGCRGRRETRSTARRYSHFGPINWIPRIKLGTAFSAQTLMQSLKSATTRGKFLVEPFLLADLTGAANAQMVCATYGVRNQQFGPLPAE